MDEQQRQRSRIGLFEGWPDVVLECRTPDRRAGGREGVARGWGTGRDVDDRAIVLSARVEAAAGRPVQIGAQKPLPAASTTPLG